MPEEDKVEKAVAQELGLDALVNGEESLTIPGFMEIEIMASQRQVWRNTAVQARNMTKVSLACGDKENAEAYGKQMRRAMSQLIQIDAMFPEAKARMQELDLVAEAQRKAQLAQLARKTDEK